MQILEVLIKKKKKNPLSFSLNISEYTPDQITLLR